MPRPHDNVPPRSPACGQLRPATASGGVRPDRLSVVGCRLAP
ncbi:hypothetical protein SBD_6208 [Streptomyces bottropensis ATCC 25435]|uniref:Uncharacterized protein n=1 Tax=Streptomyces bottropensis ATCC 25435 TaxID=1054862 RepID=M3DA10_9ACTN|nr:hypothetical protein SBD_6208 [Streptomyces bottropensis ATCC 25435]